MSDGNISQQGLRYEMLCAKLYMGEAGSLEAIAAIEQLCEDNERLASIAGRRSERIAELERQFAHMSAMLDLLRGAPAPNMTVPDFSLGDVTIVEGGTQ